MDKEFRENLLKLTYESLDSAAVERPDFVVLLARQYKEELYSSIERSMRSNRASLSSTESSQDYNKGEDAKPRAKSSVSSGASLDARQERVFQLKNRALATLDSCSDYAFFLFLTDFLTNLNHLQPMLAWLSEAIKRYSGSARLRFFYGNTLQFGFSLGKIEGADPMEFILTSLNVDAHVVLADYAAYIDLSVESLRKHPAVALTGYDLWKLIFTEVSVDEYIDSFESWLLSTLADYYMLAGDYENVGGIVERAARSWPDNPYVPAQQGYLLFARDVGDEKIREAQADFKRSLELANRELRGLPSVRVRASALNGIGYCAFKQGLYEKAVEAYNEALGISPDPTVQSAILLNRGRARLEAGNLFLAKDDFAKAGRTPPSPLRLTQISERYIGSRGSMRKLNRNTTRRLI